MNKHIDCDIVGEKRVIKLLQKYKLSKTSMNSENSSPWNVAPVTSTSPEAVSPWSVSPFQTSNPFRTPDSSSSHTKTERESDVVSPDKMDDQLTTTKPTPVFAAAFESAKEVKDPVASSPWTTAPLATAEETVPTSSWTSETSDVDEQVVDKTLDSVKKTFATIVDELVEEAVVEKEKLGAQEQDEEPRSVRVRVPVKEATTSAWTTIPVVNEAVADEDAGVAEEPAVVAASAPVERVGEAFAPVVDETVVSSKEEALAASSAWTSTPDLEESVPVATKKAIAVVRKSVAPEDVVEPAVEAAAIEVEVESQFVEEPPLETASPWTAASGQERDSSSWAAAAVWEEAASVKIAAPELAVETPDPVAEAPEYVTAAPKSVVETCVEEDGPVLSAWNSTSVQADALKKADIIKEEPIEQEVVAVAEMVEAPVEEVSAVFGAENVALDMSPAWNTTPVQEEVDVCKVDKMVKPVREEEPVEEPAVVEKVTKEADVAAVKEVVMTTEDVVKDVKIDKKAIANAFDGVTSYKVDSVTKVKKIPNVEAVAAKSADTPVACCGVGGCSIQ
ncbi:unnamed protein product [Peronospora belbahrii]|uniref:Uncharacterized protein n=1 Tax=Peronospora belbahrii TaxID=622444 RepID=A0ABN8CU64_9STRA|nr:unnamed protein product [Peronospora belbahrii]